MKYPVGGILLTQLVLEAILPPDFRPNRENSRSVHISGKLGLIKAESVIDLIDAESRESVKLASSQSRGALSAIVLFTQNEAAAQFDIRYIDFRTDLTDIPGSELYQS